MIFHFIISNIFFSLKENGLQDFCFDHGVVDALYLILKIFSGELMTAFSKVIHKKTENIDNFQVNSFISVITYFANSFIIISDFFTTFSHSLYLHHGAVVLLFSRLRSELKILFYFRQKIITLFFHKLKYFFSALMQP